jgi:hypothetical protein
MNGRKCKHETCSCIVNGGDGDCSQICRDANDLIDLACQCGHSGCAGEELIT